MYEVFMWVVAVISLTGVILNIYHRKECFILWSVTNAAWVVYDVYKQAYPQAALMLTYFGLALWGLYVWGRKKKE